MAKGVLVIGATGFIGTALVHRMCSNLRQIFTLSRGTSTFQQFSNVSHFQSDLDNQELLNQLLPACHVVIHLASETTPGSSTLRPSLEATNNLLPSLRFLETLQSYPHVRLIYVSTGGAIYGDNVEGKCTEDMVLAPLSYYGAGKAALEKFILAFCRQSGNTAVILRPSNLYGPGQCYRQGFGIIPTVFSSILNDKVMDIWGDGTAVRDYLYIDDFMDLFVEILDKIRDGQSIGIYNVGTSLGYSINDIARLAEKVTGRSVSVNYHLGRKVDVKRVVLDTTKIRDEYKWKVKTDIETGLRKTWDWFLKEHRLG
jgi:UDP-glucose 4-epimerase